MAWCTFIRRSLRLLVITQLAVAWCGLRAQQRSDSWPADSAAVARAAWATANQLWRAGKVNDAHAAMQHAASAWPSQPAYLWGETLTAIASHDTGGVLRGLEAHINAGIGRDFSADTLLRPYRGVLAIDDAARAVDANVRPLVRSTVVARMNDSTFWPEGVDYDPRSGSYYLASIRHRTVAELRPDGTVRELWTRGRADLGALMGVRVDTARNVIWATTSGAPQTLGYVAADSGIAALLRVRIADGVIERRWTIPPSARGHALGDLAIGPRGDIYVTDSNDPALYRLRPGSDTLEVTRNVLFRSPQGMAPTPDGRFLYVADYSVGIVRVDLATGRIIRLNDAPMSTSIGCDGILLADDGSIVAVQNGVGTPRIMRFIVNSDRTGFRSAQVIDRNTSIADEPTIATFAHDMIVYVANSQWDKYTDAGARIPAAALTSPVLLGIPLKDIH